MECAGAEHGELAEHGETAQLAYMEPLTAAANGMTAARKEEKRQVAIYPKEAQGQANESKQSLNAKSLYPHPTCRPFLHSMLGTAKMGMAGFRA